MADPECIEMETGRDPTAAVIVLHGLGADGSDFVPLVDELQLDPVGPVRFVFPSAPVIPVTINNGWRMRAWYDIRGAGAQEREDEAGLRQSLASVETLLARQNARGIPDGRIVLAGFSQGCAVALLTGLRHAGRLAGIAGLSGYLPLADSTAAERSAAGQATPIFLAHGEQDDIVPFARGAASRDALRALGYAVEWHAYPIGHTLSMDEVGDLQRWLLRVLQPG